MIDGSRCPSCGRVAVPPEPRCLVCRAGTDRTQLEPEGTVLAWTGLGGENDWIVLVELEGGARALAEAVAKPDGGEVVGLSGRGERFRVVDGLG